MSLPWIQVTTNLRNHPKSLRLGVKLKDSRAYLYLVDLWIWAGESCPAGELLGDDAKAMVELVIGWRGEPGAFADAALEVGFLDALNVEGGGVAIHDWEEHNGAHFRKQQRDRERYARSPGDSATLPRRKRDASATSPTVRGDKEEIKRRGDKEKEEAVGPPPSDVDPPDLAPAVEATPLPGEQLRRLWNEICAPAGLPEWRETKGGRAKALRERLKERAFDEWHTILQRIADSPFCCGRNDRGWRASPDWLLKPDTPSKVLEGKYEPLCSSCKRSRDQHDVVDGVLNCRGNA